MPQNKDLKRLVRTRMAETGENYTQALTHLQGQAALEPLPAAWHITGNRRLDYEAGLLPGVSYEGDRVRELRLRPASTRRLRRACADHQRLSLPGPQGLLQRHAQGDRGDRLGRLWLRVDGANGMLVLDNMEDRALHGTTDWTQASIVLDVADQAKILLFGALVSGAGAIDLTRLRFEEADPDLPVTVAESWVFPDEPQALDFGAEP